MRQHAGWATQAKRRNEQLVGCLTCGRYHGSIEYDQPEPIITGWRDVASILGLSVAFLVILGGVLGGLYLWAVAVNPAVLG